jgi:hypothetical protein
MITHDKNQPQDMGSVGMEGFLTHLAVVRIVAGRGEQGAGRYTQ